MTIDTDLKSQIMENISQVPIPEKILARLLDVTDRDIRYALEELRKDKIPVVTDMRGVRLEYDPSVVYEEGEKYRRLAMTYLAKMKDYRIIARELPPQQQLL